MKILIIDDEKPARMALKYLLQGMEIQDLQILEAINGEDGYGVFLREGPDIVILDINMPQMNGIDLMEKLETVIGNTKMIVISGYNEFQFAQKAIRYNVMGYLLKPINKQEFYGVMQKAMDALRHEIAMSHQLLAVSRNENIRFFKAWIRGNEGIRKEFRDCDSFTVCILRWNSEKIRNRESAEDRPQITDHQQIHLFVEQFLQNKCRSFCFEMSNSETVLVCLNRKESGALSQVLHLLKSRFRETYGVCLLTAMGSEEKAAEGLHASYRAAKKKMGQTELLSGAGDPELKTDKREQQSKNLLDPYKVTIQRCFLKNDGTRLESVLREILTQVKAGNSCTINQAELLLRQFVVFADTFYLMNGNEEAFFPGVSDWQSKIAQVCDFQEFEELFLTIGKAAMGRMKVTEMDLDWALDEVKQYIDHNYAHELSLDELAERYCFSKQYLNTNFKRKYGFNIHEYHLKTRMEKAAELLAETDLDIKEIAGTVGYSDSGYFGRIFKKVFSETPIAYRSQRQKE